MFKCLVLCPDGPPRLNRDAAGGFVRLKMFLRSIAALEGEIEILHFVPEKTLREAPDQRTLDDEAREFWDLPIRVTLAPLSRRPQTFINHYLKPMVSAYQHPFFHHFSTDLQVRAVQRAIESRPDVVFVQRLAAMCPLLRGGFRPRHVFFDLDDVEHKARLRHALTPPIRRGNLAYAASTPAVHLKERQAVRASGQSFVCSEIDRRYLARLGVSRVSVVPNAVRIPPHPAPVPQQKSLLFLGNFNHAPNVSAAERLIRQIWPIIRDQAPDARLWIAGPHAEILPSFRDNHPGVEFSGFVEDLDGLYARSRVVCCPMIWGGGTRVKLVEAAAQTKAIVATQVAAEGLEFDPDREIILEDEDGKIASACLRLLVEDDFCRALGEAAYSRALATYDAAAVERRIATLLAERLPPSIAGNDRKFGD